MCNALQKEHRYTGTRRSAYSGVDQHSLDNAMHSTSCILGSPNLNKALESALLHLLLTIRRSRTCVGVDDSCERVCTSKRSVRQHGSLDSLWRPELTLATRNGSFLSICALNDIKEGRLRWLTNRMEGLEAGKRDRASSLMTLDIVKEIW